MGPAYMGGGRKGCEGDGVQCERREGGDVRVMVCGVGGGRKGCEGDGVWCERREGGDVRVMVCSVRGERKRM